MTGEPDAGANRIDSRQAVGVRGPLEHALCLILAERRGIDGDAEWADVGVSQLPHCDGRVDHIGNRGEGMLHAAHRLARRLMADDKEVRLRAMQEPERHA